MRIETVAVHAGTRVDPGTGAVTPAIHASTTFERDPDGSYPRGFLYARNNNPNREALEECLAALEGGAAAAAFASASAATSAILLALAPGDHVVAQMDAYHGASRLLRATFPRWPRRCPRRRGGVEGPRRALRAHPRGAGLRGRGALAVRLLARAPRDKDAPVPSARPLGERAPGRHVPARPSEGGGRALSWAADPRGARRRPTSDDGVRRD